LSLFEFELQYYVTNEVRDIRIIYSVCKPTVVRLGDGDANMSGQ